jgi:hypothetical protein
MLALFAFRVNKPPRYILAVLEDGEAVSATSRAFTADVLVVVRD